MKPIKIEFTDKNITPWGGMVLFREMLNRIKFASIQMQNYLKIFTYIKKKELFLIIFFNCASMY